MSTETAHCEQPQSAGHCYSPRALMPIDAQHGRRATIAAVGRRDGAVAAALAAAVAHQSLTLATLPRHLEEDT